MVEKPIQDLQQRLKAHAGSSPKDVGELPYTHIDVPGVIRAKGIRNTGRRLEAYGQVDLRGATFLDAGCHCGAFLFEAVKAGARIACGLEVNAERVRIAQDITALAGWDDRVKIVRFDLRDLDADALERLFGTRTFDVVSFQAVIGWLKGDGDRVLAVLAAATAHTLLFETNATDREEAWWRARLEALGFPAVRFAGEEGRRLAFVARRDTWVERRLAALGVETGAVRVLPLRRRGERHAVRIEGDLAIAGRPISPVVLKTPKPGFHRELRVYRELWPTLRVAPRCLAMDDTSLLLEAVDPCNLWDQADFVDALDLLAALHAHSWGSRSLPEWLPRYAAPTAEQADECRERMERALADPRLVELTGLLHVVAGLCSPVAEACAAFEEQPWTLLHGDFSYQNTGRAPGGQMVAFDWSEARVGPAAYDVAYPVIHLCARYRLPFAGELVPAYLDALARRGIEVDRAAFERRCRVAYLQRCLFWWLPWYLKEVAAGQRPFVDHTRHMLAAVHTQAVALGWIPSRPPPDISLVQVP